MKIQLRVCFDFSHLREAHNPLFRTNALSIRPKALGLKCKFEIQTLEGINSLLASSIAENPC